MDTENTLFEIIIGTYEKYLLGYYLQLYSDEFCLKPSFVTDSHLQCVRCVTSCGKYLASGSTDETIQLFNIKSRCEIGSLVHHNGTVTGLEFYDSFLVSCSEDKTICVWSTSNWQCIKTLKGHKKPVNCLSIHPSGKMALSVSRDKTARTWNLINGMQAFVTKLGKVADIVKWSPGGSFFIVSYDRSIDVYSVENAGVLHTINFQQKICDLTFINDNICAVAGDGENIYFYDITKNVLCHQFKAHENRIKSVEFISATDELFLISASSDGQVKVWHMDLSDSEYKIRKVVEVKTGCRPTCMTVTTVSS